jgi:hypothetical protein
MWIALNNAFLSIVEPRPKDVPQSERRLESPMMVRARKAAHLSAIFPNHRIYQWKGRDYPCRVFVERTELAGRIGAAVLGIGYDNFKNSVKDNALHDAYSAVWGVMHRFQHGAFDRKPKAAGPTFWDRFEPGLDAEYGDDDDDDYIEIGTDIGGRYSHCSRADCSDDHPCAVCVRMTIDGEDLEADQYGPYDTGEDEAETAQHLQVPPRA